MNTNETKVKYLHWLCLITIANNFYVEEDFRTENCAKRDRLKVKETGFKFKRTALLRAV